MINAASAAADLRTVEPNVDLSPIDEVGRDRAARAAMWTLFGLFAIVLVRTAWICDDAYINFRTIDNFLHGHGLRWNVAERVETFTDPLWVFLLSAAVAVTREFYFTTIALSLALSIAAVALYVTRAAADSRTAAAGLLILLCSKAFVDYSTGGLENPLGHFFIVVHGLLSRRRMRDEKPGVIAARRTARRDPVREVHERGDFEIQARIAKQRIECQLARRHRFAMLRELSGLLV